MGRHDVRVVTCRDLLTMVEPLEKERTLTKEKVTEAADYLIRNWTDIMPLFGSHPPSYVDLGAEWLSLADAFQALTQTLAYYHRYGSLPETVAIREVLGPVDAFSNEPLLPPRVFNFQMVAGEEILGAAASVIPEMKERIPGRIKLGSIGEVNPVEFLYLMAQEVKTLSRTGKPSPAAFVSCNIIPLNLSQTNEMYPVPIGTIPPHWPGFRSPRPVMNMRSWNTLAQLWTVKPAKIKME